MRRTGATLVEVLVAIFVMGIGLIAILALFPLGVIRMAQAIQDGRTGNIAFNAEAIATMKLLGQDASGNPESVRHDATFISTCQNPGGGLGTATAQGPSYPVFIDPIGYRSAAATGFQNWLTGTPGTIPRISLNSIQNSLTPDSMSMRWFSFRDEIVFDINGLPQYVPPTPIGMPPPPPFFYRETRYSWAYLCQLPKLADPQVVNMAVVVFNRRTMGMGTGGIPLSEYSYSSTFDTTSNVVRLTIPQNGVSPIPPPIRLGEWVLDCTPVANPPSAHGYFYRVVSITDSGQDNNVPPNRLFDLEVQSPFRGFAPGGTYAGQTMILEGVVEVFERNSGRQP